MWRVLVSLIILAGVVVGIEAEAAVFSDDLILNGGFDTNLAGWSGNITTDNLDDQYALDGLFLTIGQYNTTVRAEQTISTAVDTGRVTLSFYYRFYTSDTAKNDHFNIKLINETTGDTVAERTMYPSRGSNSLWKKLELEATKVNHANLKVVFSVANNNVANSLTFVDIDKVKVKADSFAELSGTVNNLEGTALRNADVVIRNAKGDKVWEGTTNTKGGFVATKLKPRTKAYSITITKDALLYSGEVTVKWAKQVKSTFILQ